MNASINTVRDLTGYLDHKGLSPEKLAREIKISNMTIRRLLRQPPETRLPEKYRALLTLQEGATLFTGGQSFDTIVAELKTNGASAAGTGDGLKRLDAELKTKLEDKAIDTTLRRRVRRVMGLLKGNTLTLTDKAILAGAILYLINPIDLIPDAVPVVGYLDDLAVITLACDVVVRSVKKRRAVEPKATDLI